MIANNIMERAKDEIDFLFEATRVAHTNDEAETERMHGQNNGQQSTQRQETLQRGFIHGSFTT